MDLPIWSAIPFVLLLLCIAVMPLAAERFWHNDRNKGIIVAVLAAPVIAYLAYLQLATGHPALTPLFHEIGKYISFILLLGSLYVVAGGIVVRGHVQPTPINNAGILLAGALLANIIGTTGASVLLIRPFLRINSERANTVHLPIFFIFLVSNIGGCLTPLGDPPLFVGYLHGVPFAWTLGLWPMYLVVLGLVLAVFLAWDAVVRVLPSRLRGRGAGGEGAHYPRHHPSPLTPLPQGERGAVFGLDGKINLVFLAGIIGAVLIDSRWFPGVLESCWKVFGGEMLMLAMAVMSLIFTPREMREANAFNWAPIREVAILFLGIFITMVPALNLLEKHGPELGLTEPWQYFWGTGLLSGVLDNAPTYLAFATTAAGSDDYRRLVEDHVPNGPLILQAISCGAVFMGALTYIGNGPNFMVKSIAEQAGYRPPSFFGYVLYAGIILIPIYMVTTLFFLRW
jgi:Na+/H+ antiporter NhaD/arsenite permease-like protein